MLQITGVVDPRAMRAQYLDRMDIERERVSKKPPTYAINSRPCFAGFHGDREFAEYLALPNLL